MGDKYSYERLAKGLVIRKGHVCIYIEELKQYREVHRVMIEHKLGRKLSKHEIIHHINGNKLDNRLCNLMIMDNSEHTKLERSLRK